jgi:hypothetical protein
MLHHHILLLLPLLLPLFQLGDRMLLAGDDCCLWLAPISLLLLDDTVVPIRNLVCKDDINWVRILLHIDGLG